MPADDQNPSGPAPTGPAPTGPAPNRAARRGRPAATPPPRPGTGKVGPVRLGHGRDPRQVAAHRKG